MKKEYNKPVIEIEDMELSSLIAASPGEGSIDPEGPGIDDGGASKQEKIEW